jgi:hypothetical protein
LEREIATLREIEALVSSRVGRDTMKNYVFPDNNALKVQRNVNDDPGDPSSSSATFIFTVALLRCAATFPRSSTWC